MVSPFEPSGSQPEAIASLVEGVKDNLRYQTLLGVTGSGKTFIMANLAASFAVSGKKVLVLDLDLRKRSISKYIGRPKSGISTYLSGQSDNWRDLVKPIPDFENLFMLPAGRSAPNPAELLQSDAMKSLVEEAKNEYDYIFLDCPPAEIVADATIIKPLAEINL